MKQYFFLVLISIDQFFNVLLAPVLNRLTSDGAYPFGHPDETLSSVMGKNIERGKCRGCHLICKYFLHPLDNDHCRRSIEKNDGWVNK